MATCLQQQKWPLKDENNADIILSSDLYWNYVYPYTAVDNRIIINKSQLYSGHRAQLDVAFLEKQAGANNMSIRYIKWLIRCILDSKTLSNEDHELMLKCTKRKWNWDEHPPLDLLLHSSSCQTLLGYIFITSYISMRFSKCLSLFCGPLFEELEDMPLLFCGKGRVEDVI